MGKLVIICSDNFFWLHWVSIWFLCECYKLSAGEQMKDLPLGTATSIFPSVYLGRTDILQIISPFAVNKANWTCNVTIHLAFSRTGWLFFVTSQHYLWGQGFGLAHTQMLEWSRLCTHRTSLIATKQCIGTQCLWRICHSVGSYSSHRLGSSLNMNKSSSGTAPPHSSNISEGQLGKKKSILRVSTLFQRSEGNQTSPKSAGDNKYRRIKQWQCVRGLSSQSLLFPRLNTSLPLTQRLLRIATFCPNSGLFFLWLTNSGEEFLFIKADLAYEIFNVFH